VCGRWPGPRFPILLERAYRPVHFPALIEAGKRLGALVPQFSRKMREWKPPRNQARDAEEKMPIPTPGPNLQELLRGRYIATLGTENPDGSIHLTAVWYLFESGCLFVGTSSKSRKCRNVAARP
jgi:hypothetical protein